MRLAPLGPPTGPDRAFRVVMLVRRIDIAVAVSVLLHALLLLLVPAHKSDFQAPGAIAAAQPMDVRIVDPQPAVEAVPEPVATPPPTPSRAAPPAPQKPILTRRPDRQGETVPAPEPEAPEPRPIPQPPPVDMLAMIEARRAQRRAADAASAAPSVGKPTEDAATRNLQTLNGREGVGGVFQILRKGTRTGEFAFNGWKPDARSQWREVIEVDAGLGGDIERAMVRRMIELIRTHYSGDFHWESHRLDRVVTLSARPEDSAGLEDFMMKEFFASAGPAGPRR